MFGKIMSIPTAIAVSVKRIVHFPVTMLRHARRTNESSSSQHAALVTPHRRTKSPFCQYFNILLNDSINAHTKMLRAVRCLPKELVLTIRRTDVFPAAVLCRRVPAGQSVPLREIEPAVEVLPRSKEQNTCTEPDAGKNTPKVTAMSEVAGLSSKPESGPQSPPPPPPLSPPSSPVLRCGTSRSDSIDPIAAAMPRMDEGATKNNGGDSGKEKGGADGSRTKSAQESSAWGLIFGEAPRQEFAPPSEYTTVPKAAARCSYTHRPESSFDSYQPGFSMGTVRPSSAVKFKKGRILPVDVRSSKRNR